MRQSAIKTSFAISSGTIIAISSEEYNKKDIELLTFKGTLEGGIELYAILNSYYYVIPESSPLFNFYLVPENLQNIVRKDFSKFIRDVRQMVIDMTT